MSALATDLRARLEAHEPPEARGNAGRDDVRLLVSSRPDCSIVHGRFRDLPQFLAPGDLVVVNTSATLPAAVPATRADGERLELRLSTPARDQDPERFWIVELRRGDAPFGGVRVDEQFELPGGGTARILAPYAGVRLWLARLDLPLPLQDYLARARAADPLRLRPASAGRSPRTRTSTRVEPGSAEMASAGRPFTAELITELVAGGVLIAPITLHTGVSSQERHERPYPERYRVPEHDGATGERGAPVGRPRHRRRHDGRPRARDRRAAGRDGRRRRGLDGPRGHARARSADDRRPAQRLPRARCVAPRHAERRSRRRSCSRGSYQAALAHGYRWHEFGDSHLILT